MKSIKSIKGHKRFACLMGALLLLIMIRYAFQIDIPRIIFLLIIGMIAVFGDRNEIIAMCICCIPMHESIDFYYALVICIVVCVFKYYKSLSFGGHLVLLVAVMIWELLHCYFTSFDIVLYLSYIVPFVLLAVLMALNMENIDYPFIVRALALSVLAMEVILFVRVLYFADFNVAVAIAGLQRMGSDLHSSIQDVEIAGGQINPNTLGIIAVLASSGLLQLRSAKVGKKTDLIVMLANLVLAALGTSRTYLVCLALMIVLFIFAEKGGMINKIRVVALFAIVLGVATVSMALIFPDTFAFFVSRFFVEDITTGRDEGMKLFNRFLLDNPKVFLFGIGLQDYGNLIINVYRIWNNVPHNLIQEILIAWGIPGLLIFALQILYMYIVAARWNKKISLINWIPLIIILFKSLAGQLLTSGYSMLALALAYLSLCQDFTSTDKIDEVYNRV